MPLVVLNLENLGELANGQAKIIVNAALRAAMRDIEDRGDDDKPRKVKIEIELQKIGTGVAAQVFAETKVPPYHTAKTVGKATFDGNQPVLKFSTASPENPDQKTLVDDE